MNTRKLTNIVLAFAVFFILGYLYFSYNPQQALRKLPYYGISKNNKLDSTNSNYHVVGDFNLVNQDGKEVSQANLKGKIYITNFFFTTCHSICPIMTNQMERVVEAYKSNNHVLFISHTVDPETDSVAVLSEYAKKKGIDSNKWLLLTGNKKELYRMAREGYFLDAEEGDGGQDDFIHTPQFALIDKNKHIRGYYNGIDSVEINRLIVDIKLLLNEE